LKRLASLLTALLLVVMLTACAREANEPQSSQANGSEPATGTKVEIMVSAAASLTDALNALKGPFEREHAGITLTYNFGSSGKLAQQIVQGAPSDVFLSASPKDMEKLAGQNLIVTESLTDFAKNELVLITNQNNPAPLASFEDLASAKLEHLAIGEPESVPAGRYAKEVFEKLNLWDKLQSKLVMGSDVRQVLTFVESGNAEAGVVYASDAAIAKGVKVLATANANWHQPIVYPGAVIASSAHQKEAKEFLAFLISEKGKEVLKKYGFQ
jgi:molybdate transport system substrate-binding protein